MFFPIFKILIYLVCLQMRQRVFTGVVTQLQDRHGMVDQEVRFTISTVVGRVPLVGDKVLVKAVQDPSQSAKWTAQRVQVLNGQPFKSPPPLLHSASSNMKPSLLGNKRQPLLQSPQIPPLIPGMQPNSVVIHQLPHHQQMPWMAPFEAWTGGNRKRHNELVGGRRGRQWEEAGGSWGGDNAHQKRRRWRAPSEEETSKKSTSVASSSSFFFSFFPRDSQACDILELQRRYPHLPAPLPLFHVQLCWPESFPSSQPFPLAGPCHFHVGSSKPESETLAAQSADITDSSFSVKVMLLSMPAIEDFYSHCCNYAEDGQACGDKVHPTTLFKLLLLDRAGELQLPGGSWCPKEDGASPAKDNSTLIRTAVRCVKEQTALDLTACTQWHKMAELRLLSGDKVETVIILLPDVWNLVQTTEEWARIREDWQDEASPLPDVPSLLVHPSAGLALSAVSLSSLVEPQTSRSRDTFEVGLASELFCEMLQRDFGLHLYHSLCSLAQAKREDSSTAVQDESKMADSETTKKGVSDDKKKNHKEEGKGEDTVMKDVEEEADKQTDILETEGQAVGEEHDSSLLDDEQPCVALPRRVLLSWVFFDRHLTGHLKEDDVKNILLSLGLYLTTSQAQDLVGKFSVDGKCMYRKLFSHWTDADEVPCDLSAEGNKGLLPGVPRKEKSSSRRSANSTNPDVVTYKGTVLNISNLLQSLESSKAAQHELEKHIADLQAMLEVARARPDSDEQEQLKSRLQKVEALNKTYEKNLKENAGHMLAVIEKMQNMVDQTTTLTKEEKLNNPQSLHLAK
ncbi:cell cycle and apoptosis regulator protein 2 [Trichomycterus rosablanca]|uniref:cell cycle and apoptosis regulator protein 2 n=1 Tax=Trichomycterus rosablanca TaxID=2290929 RepID=UPI002F355242